MCVIPHSVVIKHFFTVCLISGHVVAADFSVTRLIWQAAEALAWFVIRQTARIRKKKKSEMFCFVGANERAFENGCGADKRRRDKKWRGKKRV